MHRWHIPDSARRRGNVLKPYVYDSRVLSMHKKLHGFAQQAVQLKSTSSPTKEGNASCHECSWRCDPYAPGRLEWGSFELIPGARYCVPLLSAPAETRQDA